MHFGRHEPIPASKAVICMAWSALLLGGLVHLYAGIALRGLYADGAHSLVHIFKSPAPRGGRDR
jgi:hypothetical protein